MTHKKKLFVELPALGDLYTNTAGDPFMVTAVDLCKNTIAVMHVNLCLNSDRAQLIDVCVVDWVSFKEEEALTQLHY